MRFHFPIVRRVSMPLLLLFKLLVVLLLMSLSRWLFYVFNLQEFGHLNFFELMRLMFMGLRFDLSAVFMINLPVIVLLSLPITWKFDQWYQRMVNVIFVASNALALMVNLVDIIFFRYIARRTTFEIFQFFSSTHDNQLPLMGQFFLDFWYVLLIWLLLVLVLYRATIFFIPSSPWPVRKFYWFMSQTVIFILWFGLSVLFIRGGLQGMPIGLVTAGMKTSAQNIPLVLNTPFSIVKSFGQQRLEEQHFFSPEVANSLFSPVKSSLRVNQPENIKPMPGANVVFIILESFGREHIGYYNKYRQDSDYKPGPSLTPHLDALLGQSITFEAFSNGKRSIEALPAIAASIPTLMPVDYPSSPYVTNRIRGIGTLLGEKGYYTAFFHGGNNGTMNFDAFSNTAGFPKYYGRNEYGDDRDFDGTWGIYDEPFLQYTADKLDQMPKPFLAGVFTLSSHHPYNIPDHMKDAFPNATNKVEESIAYADFALGRFFETIQQSPWYQNTIFVFTADHTSQSNDDPFYRSSLGNYAIPVAFYMPGSGLKGRKATIAQQTDIMPTTLALLGYDKPFIAFGENLFDSTARHFAINYYNSIYQMVSKDYVLHFNGKQSLALHCLETDPYMEHNLLRVEDSIRIELENLTKSIIQQYNHRLINNDLIITE